jgi:hypothetical protein
MIGLRWQDRLVWKIRIADISEAELLSRWMLSNRRCSLAFIEGARGLSKLTAPSDYRRQNSELRGTK